MVKIKKIFVTLVMYLNKNWFAYDATGVEVMCTPIEMQAGEARHGMNQKA